MTQCCSNCGEVTDTYHEVGVRRMDYHRKSYVALRIICHRCFEPVKLYDILMNPPKSLNRILAQTENRK